MCFRSRCVLDLMAFISFFCFSKNLSLGIPARTNGEAGNEDGREKNPIVEIEDRDGNKDNLGWW